MLFLVPHEGAPVVVMTRWQANELSKDCRELGMSFPVLAVARGTWAAAPSLREWIEQSAEISHSAPRSIHLAFREFASIVTDEDVMFPEEAETLVTEPVGSLFLRINGIHGPNGSGHHFFTVGAHGPCWERVVLGRRRLPMLDNQLADHQLGRGQ